MVVGPGLEGLVRMKQTDGETFHRFLSDFSEDFEVTSTFIQPGETPVWTAALTEPPGEQGAVGRAKKIQVNM